MVRIENLPTYYKKTIPHYHRFFKEVFTEGQNFDELDEKITNQIIFTNSEFLDSVYLEESKTFLRRSIFNLLSYKHLVCGKYLPMAKVSLYYSYFDAISSLIRIRGTAIVHVSEITQKFEDVPRKVKFTITQHDNHTYSLKRATKNEHVLVWNIFHDLFPDLSTEYDGRWFTQDRYEWNYGLLYPSQATDSFAQREIKIRCENNFLDPYFENAPTQEASESNHDLILDYGNEERHSGMLIKECIRLFTYIAKASEYKNEYINSFKRIKEDVDFLESSQSTKNEIKNWLNNSIDEINGN